MVMPRIKDGLIMRRKVVGAYSQWNRDFNAVMEQSYRHSLESERNGVITANHKERARAILDKNTNMALLEELNYRIFLYDILRLDIGDSVGAQYCSINNILDMLEK